MEVRPVDNRLKGDLKELALGVAKPITCIVVELAPCSARTTKGNVEGHIAERKLIDELLNRLEKMDERGRR